METAINQRIEEARGLKPEKSSIELKEIAQNPNLSPDQILEILQFIDTLQETFSRNLVLETLAVNQNLSQDHLSKIFETINNLNKEDDKGMILEALINNQKFSEFISTTLQVVSTFKENDNIMNVFLSLASDPKLSHKHIAEILEITSNLEHDRNLPTQILLLLIGSNSDFRCLRNITGLINLPNFSQDLMTKAIQITNKLKNENYGESAKYNILKILAGDPNLTKEHVEQILQIVLPFEDPFWRKNVLKTIADNENLSQDQIPAYR